MGDGGTHRPVLLDEVLDALAIDPAGCYVDGTYGRGGHAGAILDRLGDAGRLLAFDRDPEAERDARERFGADRRFIFEAGSFVRIESVVGALGLTGKVRGILLDLGVSSPQIDDPARGFSFQQEGPLDMRMDPAAGESAAEWLARAGEREIADVIYTLGEEPAARRIARAVVATRLQTPIRRTLEFARLVASAGARGAPGRHPATRTFQALRIHINHELVALEQALDQAARVLCAGGRLVVISFHSLEDRIVKRFMRDAERGIAPPPGLPVRDVAWKSVFRRIGGAIRPAPEEIAANPRARSAVLRVAERCPA